nr:MGMT family protein [uncultured Duncaniella sp.]
MIGADGSLTGYSAGTDIKAFLLRLEGIDLF